ncbi:hypothetical protein BC936DRAFT_142285 [Jimgerdemannia flammicorona]|uniref:Uncharacterized protein n=1 Tax=Jimgerdemannia flammicorona TaxID=994334 RepID=A0A433A122_9FUNG|nr:hypothetical protein BC936DRAFT_142285 [Jimgerdemannia flammicorona]
MNCKKVHFGNDVEFIPTFADDEYDRTCQEVAKMTYSDMVELLQVKAEYRRQMEKMCAQMQIQSVCEPCSPPPSPSPTSSTSSIDIEVCM